MTFSPLSDPTIEISWSDIPNDLLGFIAERLYTHIDVKRLRAACSPWRSSVLPRQRNPFQFLPFPLYNSNSTQRSGNFKICETVIYRLQSDNSDAILRVEETESGKVRVRDLFGSSKVAGFSQTPSSKVIDLLNFRLSEITKVYDLKYIEKDNNTPIAPVRKDRGFTFQKVVLSSAPVSNSHDYAVLAVKYVGILCYAKLGDDMWTVMKNEDYNGKIPRNFTACDVVNYKDKFYITDQKGFVIVLDYEFKITEIVKSPVSDGFSEDNPHYLIMSGKELYLVSRKDHSDADFFNATKNFDLKVYKLDEQERNWVEVRNLGDKALFLCRDRSFAVSAPEFAGFNRGFIYFLDENFSPYFLSTMFDKHVMPLWVFDLENGRCKRLSDHKLF